MNAHIALRLDLILKIAYGNESVPVLSAGRMPRQHNVLQVGQVIIGLDLGAVTVPEIAASIVAQLVLVRRKRKWAGETG